MIRMFAIKDLNQTITNSVEYIITEASNMADSELTNINSHYYCIIIATFCFN
jgi:hypothetical protein